MAEPMAHLKEVGNKDGYELALTVRCLVESKQGEWQAFSLEFGLAAQGETLEDAKRRLDAMLQSYIHDALVGEDRAHAHDLLSRRATWRVYLRYYLSLLFDGASSSKIYRDPLPLDIKDAKAFAA